MEQIKIRIFLIDDHPIVHEGVYAYLTDHSIEVVGEASNASEAFRKVKKLAPDVIIFGVNLPSINDGKLVNRLHRLVPKSNILIFSIHSSEDYAERMARSGARGVVTKDQPTAELFNAIKHVYQGGLQFPAGVVSKKKKHKPAP